MSETPVKPGWSKARNRSIDEKWRAFLPPNFGCAGVRPHTIVPGDAACNGATIAAFGGVAHAYVFIEDTARGSTTALAYTDLAVRGTVKKFASGAPPTV
jgi:hypothetical protein